VTKNTLAYFVAWQLATNRKLYNIDGHSMIPRTELFGDSHQIVKSANIFCAGKQLPNLMSLIYNLAFFWPALLARGFPIRTLLFGCYMELDLPTPESHPPSWGTLPPSCMAYPPPKMHCKYRKLAVKITKSYKQFGDNTIQRWRISE